MKKSSFWLAIFLVTIFIVLCPDSASASPGGKIVSGLFKSTWGRILLGVLTATLLPVLVYAVIKERVAEKRTLKHLARLEKLDPHFNWTRVKERVTDCYHRVHAAWRAEDMSEASDWMTNWYWQNQQLAYLNQWERDGLVNRCHVKSIGKIRPLFLHFKQDDERTCSGSKLVVSITATMEDYLEDRATGKIVEGAKGYSDTEHVWTFELKQGRWLVANIEEGSTSLNYAGMAAEVPDVLPKRTVGPSPAA